jgi:hypothetical protein
MENFIISKFNTGGLVPEVLAEFYFEGENTNVDNMITGIQNTGWETNKKENIVNIIKLIKTSPFICHVQYIDVVQSTPEHSTLIIKLKNMNCQNNKAIHLLYNDKMLFDNKESYLTKFKKLFSTNRNIGIINSTLFNINCILYAFLKDYPYMNKNPYLFMFSVLLNSISTSMVGKSICSFYWPYSYVLFMGCFSALNFNMIRKLLRN